MLTDQRKATALALFFGLVLVLAGCAHERGDGPDQQQRLLELLPKLPAADGSGRFDPTSVAGKPVLVSFFSVTCGACVHEMRGLQAAVDAHKKASLVFVAVDGQPRRALATVRANGGTAPVLAGGGALARQLNVHQVPTTFVIDHAGKTKRVLIGERSRHGFEYQLARL